MQNRQYYYASIAWQWKWLFRFYLFWVGCLKIYIYACSISTKSLFLTQMCILFWFCHCSTKCMCWKYDTWFIDSNMSLQNIFGPYVKPCTARVLVMLRWSAGRPSILRRLERSNRVTGERNRKREEVYVCLWGGDASELPTNFKIFHVYKYDLYQYEYHTSVFNLCYFITIHRT